MVAERSGGSEGRTVNELVLLNQELAELEERRWIIKDKILIIELWPTVKDIVTGRVEGIRKIDLIDAVDVVFPDRSRRNIASALHRLTELKRLAFSIPKVRYFLNEYEE